MKKYTFALFIFCAIAFTGCLNNDFMERYPLGNPTEETAFVTYDNFKAYAWDCMRHCRNWDTVIPRQMISRTIRLVEAVRATGSEDWSLYPISGMIQHGTIMPLFVVSI